MPLRIGFRVRSSSAWIGGVHYVLNWTKTLNTLDPPDRPAIYLLYSDPDGESIARGYSSVVAGVERFDRAHLLNLDIVYPITQLFEAPLDAPWAGWIPDWQYKHLPEMFDELERERRDLNYRLLATRAPFLVVSSQMAYYDTVRFVGQDLVPMATLPFAAVIEASHITDADASELCMRYGLPIRFYLVCNQFWKHKNHIVILRALMRLKELPIVCVFTGDTNDHRWPEHFQELRGFILEHSLEGSVRLLGSIPREDQLRLMQVATCIIQPSLFEGWSTVVEEARALGQCLLLSDILVHREQAPPGALYFAPEDDKQLAELMRNVWHAARASSINQVSESWREGSESYIENCARKFLKVTAKVRTNYDPHRHDPAIILAEVLPYLYRSRDRSNAKAELYSRTVTATRRRMKAQPEKLAILTSLISTHAPDYLPQYREQIAEPNLWITLNDQFRGRGKRGAQKLRRKVHRFFSALRR